MKIASLRREAREAAKWRGHDLTRFKQHDYWSQVQWAKCRNCDARVACNARPAPNEIDIGGDAVAVGCPVEDRS
jgi:hypothetical protein